MSRRPFVPIFAAAVGLTLLGPTLLLAQVGSESTENTARQEKNRRYNGGRCNLTLDQECIEQYEPAALPLIPIEESTVAFVGHVTGVQAYLSADRTHIYTETTFRVQEMFKSPENFRLPSDQTLITDQIGGTMKMPSGQILQDNTRSGFMGKPRLGSRYVLFLTPIHEGKDFAILRAYELREGKVFKLTEDGSPGNVLLSGTGDKPDSLSDEQAFLQTIRHRKSLDPKTGNLHVSVSVVATTKAKQ